MLKHVSHAWAEDEDWEEGKIWYNTDYEYKCGRQYLAKLRQEDMGQIGFNGFVFRYMDYDWKPTGEEAHLGTPAGSDIVMRSGGSAPEDEVMAAWEAKKLENPSQANAFLKKNFRMLGVVAPYHGDILLRRHPTEPEVYFSPKGYFTIAEICRIMWFRNRFRPELERWGCVEYMGLCEVNRGGQFVGWRAKIEDTGT
jgi:hypothetical protein